MLADPLSFPLAILRQETFVLSECSGFGASGRARRRKSERGKADGRTDDGREEGVGDQSRRGSFVDKRPGCLSPPLPLSASPLSLSLCVPASTDDRPRSENAAFAATQRRTTEKEKRNVERTKERAKERTARQSGGKSALHALFAPLHRFLNMQKSDIFT